MKIYITEGPLHIQKEVELIKALAEFEGNTTYPLYPGDPLFNRYYKGGHPAILIKDELDRDKGVVYGFWAFVEYYLENGFIRC
jgi:hypothetical protein